MTRHFLKDDDLTPLEQEAIIERAIKLKADRFAERPFAGPQTVAVIFDNGCIFLHYHLPILLRLHERFLER